jgi:hypothetical protein
MTAVKELSTFKLDFVEVQDVRWDEDGTESAGEYTFTAERGMRIMN